MQQVDDDETCIIIWSFNIILVVLVHIFANIWFFSVPIYGH